MLKGILDLCKPEAYTNTYSVCVLPLRVLQNGGVSEYYTEKKSVLWAHLTLPAEQTRAE